MLCYVFLNYFSSTIRIGEEVNLAWHYITLYYIQNVTIIYHPHYPHYLQNMWHSLQQLQQFGVTIVRDTALLGKVVVV